jgi:16S rRNA (cytidine1402-2'-O)-methyltransferase
MSGTLYLLPVHLSEGPLDLVLPEYNNQIINNLKHFVVEDIRSARRFLKMVNKDFDIDACTFYTLNEHSNGDLLSEYLKALEQNQDVGLLSEAGCPAVADPGSNLVALAHLKGFRIKPLVGPSSILLALMASGFSGQRFSFDGYLPLEKEERTKRIKTLETRSYTEDCTQIFIETPYRNNKLMEDLTTHLKPQTKICMALDLTGDEEQITTKSVSAWKKVKFDIPKKPCIFLLYKGF